jgi:hypothetical protein
MGRLSKPIFKEDSSILNPVLGMKGILDLTHKQHILANRIEENQLNSIIISDVFGNKFNSNQISDCIQIYYKLQL